MPKRDWTYEELLLAFNLYCRLPFGLFHRNNPEVIALSELINRTPSAVAMKLSNFASFDPNHRSRGVKGLSNASKADEAAWNKFTSNWARTIWDSEVILARLQGQQPENKTEEQDEIVELGEIADIGETQIERITKVRVGQRFFRSIILANYRERCCVCGMSIPPLLVASHIIPWHEREDLRLNPHNGLCLCVLHDKAFDTGFLTVNEQYQVVVSKRVSTYIPNESIEMNIISHHGNDILLPEKFTPVRHF